MIKLNVFIMTSKEILFDDGRFMRFNRAGMWTLEPFIHVSPSAVTVFAMVLNNDWIDKRKLTRFCFRCVELVSSSLTT